MSAVVENAVGMIASEAHGVIGLILSRISAEIQLARGFTKELEELQSQLTKLSGLLQGASSAHLITNPLMADWLKKINDAAFDAEILLDQWSYKALKLTSQNKFMRTVSRPFNRHAMAHKVRNMRKSIGGIYNDARELGIKPVQVAGGEVYSGIHSRGFVKQDKKLSQQRQCVDLQLFRGRDEDVKKLVKLLCHPKNNTNSHLTVIGIVGLPGLGKTALSKHISKVQEVTKFFNSMVIWVVVSHNYDLMDLLKKMVEILFGEKREDRQALIEKLEMKMKGKKYLIILDDVWDTIDWEPLKSTLHEIGVSHGTTLLVTSRDREVVKKLKTPKRPTIHKLQELSPGNSWSLFKEKYYDEIVVGSEKEDLAKRMMDRCGGVPLAIRVVADLLRDKDIKEWRKIEKSEIWTQENDNGILPSLRLSYNYLPHIALKKCFAYCAIFQEDEVIQKQELIYMWMAQGFLQPKERLDEEMEHTGEKYIQHLLNCSLLQEAEMDDEYDRVETYKMHDLVWTLARDVSMGECLCLSLQKDVVVTGEVRHLLIQGDIEIRELTSKSFAKLQTCLLGECNWISFSVQFWMMCKQLRVLNVGGQQCESINWKPLRSLIHLRYFAVIVNDEKDFLRSNLPNQITKLHHLQTLYIHICDNFMSLDLQLPVALFLKKANRLPNLRHILINLRIGIPVGLRHLTGLQTLPVIDLGLNWGGRISDVGLLSNLRGKLEIHLLSLLTSVEEARSLHVGSKSDLESLVLQWGNNGESNPNADEILEAMQPNSNLQEFELSGFDGNTFPRWLMGPGSPLNNIVSLMIQNCDAHGNLKLENFTCLRILKVLSCNKLTITFPNNRSQCCQVQIYNCDKVRKLDLLLLPKLQHIEIWSNNSTRRDVLVGLGNLPCLKELKTDLQLPVDLGEDDTPVCESLEELTLVGSKYNNNLSEQVQHLVALRSLSIEGFESVEAIPNWLGKLTSLEKLRLNHIPELKHLPSQDVMSSLSNLTDFKCYRCPHLENDLQFQRGEWFKIAHIPHIDYTEKLLRAVELQISSL